MELESRDAQGMILFSFQVPGSRVLSQSMYLAASAL